MGLIRVVSDSEQLYELPPSDNIYTEARNECIRRNILKYPFQRYTNDVDTRVRDFAKSRNMNINAVRGSVLRDAVALAAANIK